jgi:hypothetical protein
MRNRLLASDLRGLGLDGGPQRLASYATLASRGRTNDGVWGVFGERREHTAERYRECLAWIPSSRGTMYFLNR